MTVGDRIRIRRKEIGLSADELAEQLGKNRATVYRYESNDIENLPVGILEPLANALDCSPSYLMGWESASFGWRNSKDQEKNRRAAVASMFLCFGNEGQVSTVHSFEKESAFLYYKPMNDFAAGIMRKMVGIIGDLPSPHINALFNNVTEYLKTNPKVKNNMDEDDWNHIVNRLDSDKIQDEYSSVSIDEAYEDTPMQPCDRELSERAIKMMRIYDSLSGDDRQIVDIIFNKYAEQQKQK